MKDAELEQIVRTYIDKTFHMSLGTASNNIPWVSEVHFAYDNDLNIYFVSLPSKRHSQEIAVNPTVAGSIVDKYGLDDHVVGVYFDGVATHLSAGPDMDIAAACLKYRLDMDDVSKEAARPDGHQIYMIRVKNWHVFGEFHDQPPQKYTRSWSK